MAYRVSSVLLSLKCVEDNPKNFFRFYHFLATKSSCEVPSLTTPIDVDRVKEVWWRVTPLQERLIWELTKHGKLSLWWWRCVIWGRWKKLCFGIWRNETPLWLLTRKYGSWHDVTALWSLDSFFVETRGHLRWAWPLIELYRSILQWKLRGIEKKILKYLSVNYEETNYSKIL